MAENGKQALDLFQQQPFDLVIMDIEMPEMDGLMATKQIRAWEQQQGRKAVPILALTAHTIREVNDKAMRAGCTAYLSKPIQKMTFLDALARYGTSLG